MQLHRLGGVLSQRGSEDGIQSGETGMQASNILSGLADFIETHQYPLKGVKVLIAVLPLVSVNVVVAPENSTKIHQ